MTTAKMKSYLGLGAALAVAYTVLTRRRAHEEAEEVQRATWGASAELL